MFEPPYLPQKSELIQRRLDALLDETCTNSIEVIKDGFSANIEDLVMKESFWKTYRNFITKVDNKVDKKSLCSE